MKDFSLWWRCWGLGLCAFLLAIHGGVGAGPLNGVSFGFSVAISGDTAVVGVPLDTVNGNAARGSAYVYVRTGTTWTQQAQLIATDGLAADRFGTDVAINGDTVVVGAPSQNNAGSSGTAYVFTRTGTTWTQQQILDKVGKSLYGTSVTINSSGGTIAIGAPAFDSTTGNDDQGAAYIYTLNGTTWSIQQTLTNTSGNFNDQFGYDVALDGNTLAVGQPGNNNNRGSTVIFLRSSGSWSQQARITPNDPSNNDFFGRSVSISSDSVVVGAPGKTINSNAAQGAAYVFLRSGTTWSQQQRLVATSGNAQDILGTSVVISGDTVAAGTPGDTVNGNPSQGSAYVFVRTGTIWVQQPQKVLAPDGVAGDIFGPVALSGTTLLIGAPGADLGTSVDQGAAYVFLRSGNGTTWTGQQKLFLTSSVVPTVTSFSPPRANFGDSVVVTGTGFTGATAATFNGLSTTFTVNSDTQITATVPPGAISGVIQITTAGGTAASTTFIVNPVAVRNLGWQQAGTGDFNGDGRPDLLWRNYTTGVNRVWLMSGIAFISQTNLQSQTDPNWQLVGAADFTGDNKPDLLWRNFITGQNVVWEMNGTTFVQTRNLDTVTDPNFQLAGVGDLTGDGKPDLIWRNYGNGDVYLWQMNGTTYVTSFFIGPVVDPYWQMAGVGDFTNDGNPDLIWRYWGPTGSFATQVYLWQMLGFTYQNAFLIGPVSLDFQLTGVGEFTGDSQLDLFWSNNLTGQNFVWLMSGYTYQEAFFIGPKPTD